MRSAFMWEKLSQSTQLTDWSANLANQLNAALVKQEKDRPLVFWEDDEEAMPEIAVTLSATASYPLADSSVSHDAEQSRGRTMDHGVHLPAVRAARICTPQQK